MELIIPQQFPRDVPYLYIRPERGVYLQYNSCIGSKILPIPGYVDASGCVICNVVYSSVNNKLQLTLHKYYILAIK